MLHEKAQIELDLVQKNDRLNVIKDLLEEDQLPTAILDDVQYSV